MAAVSLLTGLAVQTIYNKVSKGEFPKPYKPSTKKAIWYEEELVRWIRSTKQGDVDGKNI